ncbi:MAG: TatD family hydrolase [Lentisphaeria bacterium]|nr:TatD family hydrolase [Lentisphaeria bacterium]
MILFDTHFHFDPEDGDPCAYRQMVDANGHRTLLMAAGCTLDSGIAARNFARSAADSWFCAGVHPLNVTEKTPLESDHNRELWRDDRCCAVGELGLDYYYESESAPLQRKVLHDFLAAALEEDLPAVIHCRDQEGRFDAYEDCYALLKDFASAGGRMSLHCFAGTPEWVERFSELDAYFGVTGMVTFRKADNIRESLQKIPRNRLLIETDSPYLAPIPHRGKRNSPLWLPHVAERVAEEWGADVESTARITTRNALDFYRIGGIEIA